MTLKKILSLLIAMIMALGCVSIPAMAEEVSSIAGDIQVGYLTTNFNNSGRHGIYGEATSVVGTESFEVKLYSGETLVGTAALVDPDKVLLCGQPRTISWHILVGEDNDSWWNTAWVDGALNVNSIPDKVELYVDGYKVSEGEVKLNSSDDSYPIIAAVTDENGNVQSFVAADGYTNNMQNVTDKLNAALNAEGNNTVVLLRDETTVDTIAIPAGVKLVMDGGKFTANKVTATGEFNVYGESTLNITEADGNNSIDFYKGAVISNTTIGGDVTVISEVTFRGDNTFSMLSDFGTAYSGSDPGANWTVEPGASVTLTKASRYGLGYGDKVTIKGEIADATMARESLTAEDASFFTNGVALMDLWDTENYITIEDAYVVLGSNNSFGTKSDYGKKGAFIITFTNSVIDSSRVTIDPNGGAIDFTFTGSDIKVGAWSDKSTESIVKFSGSKMLVTGNGTDWNNENAGQLTLTNSDITFQSGTFTNSGNITIDANSSITAPTLAGTGKIVIDAKAFNPDGEAVNVINTTNNNFEGEIEVINNRYAMAVKNEDGTISIVKNDNLDPVAKIGDTPYVTLKEALDAAVEGDTIQIVEGATIEEGELAIPSVFKNITIEGTDGAYLKNTHLVSRTTPATIEGLTINGVVFDNSHIMVVAWDNNTSLKDWTIINSTFKNLDAANNEAALHLNVGESVALENLTFKNNVIQNLTGGDKSGIYGQYTGNIVLENNLFDNIAFRPYVIQLTSDDGIADSLVVKGNIFSGSAAGRAQALTNNSEGTDAINLVVNNNIFKDITSAQQICYWNFNPETTTADFSKNYYDIELEANPSRIYFNSAAGSAEDLIEMGIYPRYTELNEDGTINLESEYTYVLPEFVAKVGDTSYKTLADAVSALKTNGGTLTLLADVNESITLNYPAEGAVKELTIDLNGYKLTSAESTLWVSDGYDITVKDSSETKTGKIVTTSTGDEAIAIARGGKVTLESGSVEGIGYGVYLYSGNATGDENFVVNGGTVEVPNGGTAIAIGAGKATINGGKVLCNKVPNGSGWLVCVYENGALEITGGEFLGTIGNWGTTAISGGTFSYCDDSNDGFREEHLAPGYIIKESGEREYVVEKFTLSGIGTAEDPFLIKTLDELKLFRNDVNNGNTYKGKYIKVAVEKFDLTGEDWTPIGNSDNNFQGHFDGNNVVIENLTIDKPGTSNIGFFGFTTNGSVKNITFNNANVAGRLNVGVAAGTPYTSTYDNITLTGHVEVNGMAYVGGVGGKNVYADWTDITVDVDSTSYVKATSTENGTAYRTYVGGVIGFMGEGGHTVRNVTSNINVIGDVCDIGGIVGIAHYGNNFENITCTGNVECTNTEETEVGGIAGTWHNEKGNKVTFNDISYSGTVTVGGVDVTSTNAYTGAAYNADNTTEENSGSLIIDNETVWPLPVHVAQIGDTYYETFEDALNAVENGQTITLLDVTGSELSKEIEFTKDIEFAITGKAPNYALPVVTFQNATVTIEDAEILIPELDARQKATINVVDSIVHDAGGNSIVKSYYNGAINISGTSVVHTMQVTTMGYITISDTAKLNATWQTNVYGNGMITVEETATFATAALHLTGKDYSGRDNTDDDRVGKPATIVVDGATFIVGKVYSDNGADYSYNSSKGINIGTIDGKSAVLDIKNGATMNIYMANGETANIGANGTVNVSSSVFNVACRAENSTVTLANNGVVNVDDSNLCIAEITNNGTINLTTANATLTTPEATLVVNSTVGGYKVVYADGKYIMEKVSYVAQIGDTKYTSLQTALDAAAACTGNVTVEILEDINLTGVDWNPVTVSAPGYPVVTVNGNNKTITGLNDMLFAGTWAGKSGLIINDLTIKDSSIVNDKDDAKGTVGVGAFIGYPQASATITLNNCHLVDSTVEGGHWTGGLIGMAGGYNGNDGPVFMDLTIKGCSVTGSNITGKGSAGGVIGHGSCAAWTNVVIEDTTVSGNTIISTGSSNNKAGAVMGTIGAAGQPTTADGVTKTGGASVSATVSGNNVTSGDKTITTIYGRQGTETGMLYVTGGTYDNYPIEENVTYAQPKEGYEIVKNENGTYGVKKLFEFYGVSVVLGNSLELKFYLESSQFDGTDYSAKIVHSTETGDKEKTVDFNQWETSGIYKTFSYSGIAAKQMTDDVSVVIYDKNGNPVSVELVTSLEKYALGHLANYEAKKDKTQSDLNWMTAMVDMLNYGAAAQVNFGYKEETLANANAVIYQVHASGNVALEKDLVSSGNAYATSVTFADKIVFNAYFENVTKDMYAKVEFTDHYGTNKNHEITYDKFVPNGKYHMVVVDKLVIADAAQNVKVTLCDQEGNVCGEISESVNGYLYRASKASPDKELYPAMARFSASAKKTLAEK